MLRPFARVFRGSLHENTLVSRFAFQLHGQFGKLSKLFYCYYHNDFAAV